MDELGSNDSWVNQGAVASLARACGFNLSGCQLTLADFKAMLPLLHSQENNTEVERILEAARQVRIVKGLDTQTKQGYRWHVHRNRTVVEMTCNRQVARRTRNQLRASFQPA